MRMGNRWRMILIVSLVFNIAVMGSLVYGLTRHQRADGEREYPDERIPGGGRGKHLGRRMGLAPEKLVRVERIFDASREETTGLRERLGTERGRLVELLHADHPDQDAIMGTIDESWRN